MEGKIVSLEPLQLVSVAWTGPYQYASQIRTLWKQFYSKVGEVENRSNSRFLCPSHDRQTDFTYYIGVEVGNFDYVPQGLMALTVPAHKYAVFTHVGPMDEVQDTYHQIFTWLSENGYQKDEAAFSLESYDERYNPATDDHNAPTNAFEIYVPVK